MFSVLSKSITKQVNRVRREFQEVIRPVVDRAVENAFERYLQEGATRNNPINSSNPNLYNRFNNFFERHQYITNAGIAAFTLILGGLTAKFGFDALQYQQAAYNLQQQLNELQEAIIRSNQELAESIRELAEVNRQLAGALNQSNNSEESSGSYYRIFRIIADLSQIGRTLFDFGRFFTNRGGHTSGSRDSNDTEFTTPPSGRAHRERRERDR